MHGTTTKGEKIVIAIGAIEIVGQLIIFISGLITWKFNIFGIVPILLFAALMVAVYLGKGWAKAIYIAVAALSIVAHLLTLAIIRPVSVISILIITARFVMITLLLADSSVREFLESQRDTE